MKVIVKDASFKDHSRGRRVTRWNVSVELEGVVLFTQVVDKYIPHSSGYSGHDQRAANKADAKRKTVQAWAEKIQYKGYPY